VICFIQIFHNLPSHRKAHRLHYNQVQNIYDLDTHKLHLNCKHFNDSTISLSKPPSLGLAFKFF